MLDCLETCVPGINVHTLATFDVDYMFTQVRSKSVGETTQLLHACSECNEENEVKVNLQDINIVTNDEGVRYYTNPIYPEVPASDDDIYVITTGTDRYDTLALQFYQDSRLWWVIASANNSKTDSLAVQQGIQLRIPSKPGNVITSYNELNENR